MLSTMLGQTARLYRPTASPDGFGDSRLRWPSNWQTTPAQTVSCRLQWTSGYELRDGKNVAVGQWKLFLPPAAAVSEKDRVGVDSKLFEIEGVYPVYAGPALHHYECTLTTFSGEVPRGD